MKMLMKIIPLVILEQTKTRKQQVNIAIGVTPENNSIFDAKVVAPLKYLSNF